MALRVKVLLGINRFDLARKTIAEMKALEDDNVLTILA
jgi:hypothetical protein